MTLPRGGVTVTKELKMGKKIWRYTLSASEQKLWDTEEMQGWRTAMIGCVEDDAREEGSGKYVIYDRKENIVAKGDVTALPVVEPVEL
jgi:hypothetical protein